MITIKNVKMLDGRVVDYSVPSQKDSLIEADGKLTLLPALIDPHTYLGAPDHSTWEMSLNSVIRGGITTVLEIPHPNALCDSKNSLEQKKQVIEKHLKDLDIPLHYLFYSGYHRDHLDEIGLTKKLSVGIVLQLDAGQPMASFDAKLWDRLFQLAAWEDMPIVMNGNNENSSDAFKQVLHDETILERAISFTEKHSARLYVLNVSTQQEINLIKEARERTLLVYAETTLQHLFQKDAVQADLLWEAVKKKTIETIGSGYNADDQGKQRILFQGGNFSLSDPGFMLPQLLNAYHDGKISLERIVEATRLNINELFRIDRNADVVLVDMEKEQTIQITDGKAPKEQKLKGWPLYTILKGEVFTHSKIGYSLEKVN